MLVDPSGHDFEEAEAIRDSWRENGNWDDPQRLAGMEDDDLMRTQWLDEYIQTGRIAPGLAADMENHGQDTINGIVNYYVRDTIEDESGSFNFWAGVATAVGIIVGGVVGLISRNPKAGIAAGSAAQSASYYWITGDETLSGLHEANGGQDVYITMSWDLGGSERRRPHIGRGNNDLKNIYMNSNGDLLDIRHMYASNLPGDTMSTDTGLSYWNDYKWWKDRDVWDAAFWGASEGAAAAFDGIIPFFDPLKEAYTVNGNNIDGTQWSYALGEIARDLYLFSSAVKPLHAAKNGWHYGNLGYHEIGNTLVKRNLGRGFSKGNYLHYNTQGKHFFLKWGTMGRQMKYWKYAK